MPRVTSELASRRHGRLIALVKIGLRQILSLQSVEASQCPWNRHKSAILEASPQGLPTLRKMASYPTAMRVSTLRRIERPKIAAKVILTRSPNWPWDKGATTAAGLGRRDSGIGRV